jgi:hypothetical protein
MLSKLTRDVYNFIYTGAFKKAVNSIENILDLQLELKTEMRTHHRNDFAKDNFSLSDTCKCYLGKPLSKINRISDWQARPLTKSQMFYASLDAHSLIGIFDALLLEKNLDCGLKVAINQYNGGKWIAENRLGAKLVKSTELKNEIKTQ